MKLKEQRGFTLIEMLIVLFIIGTLIVMVMPNLSATGQDAQVKSCDANKKMLTIQAEAYYLARGHKFPDTVNDLLTQQFIKELPVCAADLHQQESEDYTSYTFKKNGSDLEVICAIHDHLDSGSADSDD